MYSGEVLPLAGLVGFVGAYPGLTPWANDCCPYGASITSGHCDNVRPHKPRNGATFVS